ncbi:T9SS type A sorting domain-containing protein [Aureisphaera galaxeae]|uniref:T9SS type A sorting domain-containing protein n=1 Tax=Aureisphaera galaxeae TaxID=1538023 RepID=UPI00235052BD|nr:T9SS type A sorting domain-containing protein [Aureisphaera galaxeae]MDC8004771.1 T9SS type A sorting domain-containing protein [Aureisphaera galaxeae]
MKHKYFLAMVLCVFFAFFEANAQFMDDMEYPDACACSSWWTTWEDSGNPLIVVGNKGEKIGHIPSQFNDDAVLFLGNQIFGDWGLEFDMYIPSGKEAYFSLQGIIPVTGGEYIVGHFLFNENNILPGVGEITDTFFGSVTFDFPHDEWFRVAMNFELLGISGPSWGMSVNDAIVIEEGSPFINSNGSTPTSLGGVEFRAVNAVADFFVDNFNFEDNLIILNTVESQTEPVVILPNPVNDTATLFTNEPVDGWKVYGIQGNLILDSKEGSGQTIPMTALPKGIYLVEVRMGDRKSIQRLIKK